MSRTADRSIADQVTDLRRAASMLAPVHVQTTIVVCGRHEPWSAALSCAADLEGLLAGEHGHPAPSDPRPVVELEVRRDLDLLIEPRSGLRLLRTEANAERFDELIERYKPERVDLRFTVHEAQLDPLLDAAAIVAFLGGNRAGKTYIALIWLIRRWILIGGVGRSFWIVAPTLTKAFRRMVGKPGEVSLTDLLPARLRATSMPTHDRGDLSFEMIDGSTFEAMHGFGSGDNLKSERVDAMIVDEVSSMPDLGVWHQIKARTMQGGRAFLSTTPKAGHWAYDKVVLAEPHSGGQISVYSVDLFQNPWVTSAEALSHLLGAAITATELDEVILPSLDWAATCRALVEDPTSLREDFGKWTVEGVVLWSDWSDVVAKMCTFAGAGLEPETVTAPAGHAAAGLQLPNITPMVAHGFFGEAPPPLQVWGEDFNINPQTCLRAQIHGIHAKPETWTLVLLEEVQTRGSIEAQGAKMQRVAPGACIVCDPSGDIPRRKQESTEGDEAATMRALGFHCHSAVGRGRRLKSQRPTTNLIHKLQRQRRVMVHTRCRQTLRAFQLQRAKPDGRIDKRAGVNSASDQMSSPTDAMRYLAWPMFKHEVEAAAEWST